MSESHACVYTEQLEWSAWARAGSGADSGLSERLARRIPRCAICGRERQARHPRRPVGREARAETPEAPPLADAAGRAVAAALVKSGRDGRIRARGLLTDLAWRGIPASLAEEWIERFLRAGWLTVTWQLGDGSPRLAAVDLVEPERLSELAWPGAEGQRRTALREARARVALLSPQAHPKSVEIAGLLGSAEAASFPPSLLQALAAVAVHAESGEVLAKRVFSARHLGNSKALARLQVRLERLIGPLSEIGVREGAGVTLLGGQGVLHREGAGLDLDLDLAAFAPFVGLARETVEAVTAITFPAGGLFAVENLAVFEACCRGEVAAAQDVLIAWSAGYPGRTFRRLVELAAAAAAPLTVWADLDLDGVRIARLIASWFSSTAGFYRMSPADLAAAPRSRPLSARSLAAIRRDLEERPAAPLAETLRALLESGGWVEQESFLGGSPSS